MSLKSLWKHLTKSRRNRHSFSEADRDKASLRKKINAIKKAKLDALKSELDHLESVREMRQLEDEIDELREEVYEDEDEGILEDAIEGPEQLFLKLANRVLDAPKKQQEAPDKTSLTDAEIKGFYDQMSASEKVLVKKMSDEELISQVVSRMPKLNEDSISRILSFVRSS